MITRFAPSPTGYLHIGHAYSALKCREIAGSEGRLLLRFEDIDYTRVREEYYTAIEEDLQWMGIAFTEKPWKQRERLEHYHKALELLKTREVVYPCFCTRKELSHESELSAPHGHPKGNYSGKCKVLTKAEREEKMELEIPFSWRLDAQKAKSLVGELSFQDEIQGTHKVNPDLLGDVILARKDIHTSYHIAVVVDDAAQEVTDIVRGEDLLESTHVHRLLQELLGYPAPTYHHHSLILDEHGKRLAKRDDALAIRTYRERGMTREGVLSLMK